jgi:uncharacterized membrane protein YidH (DUF202 family)
MGAMRTIMAADRTLMAWIRTSLSMLSFGFTIYKFLQTIASEGPMEHPNSPQQVGLFLTGMGVASIVFGTLGYWVTLAGSREDRKVPDRPARAADGADHVGRGRGAVRQHRHSADLNGGAR